MLRTDRTDHIPTWKLIVLAGLAGGLAEILWITAYSGSGRVDGAVVAQQVVASFWPAAVKWSFASALGVVIHLALSVALAAAAVPLLSRIAAGYRGAGIMLGSAMLMLAMVWKVNFFIILPLVNPAFASLMPYGVTLVSKLLFGMTLGLVMYNLPAHGIERNPQPLAGHACAAACCALPGAVFGHRSQRRQAPRAMKFNTSLGGVLALLPVAAWAFQPLVTDDTGTQGAAGNQIEAAYNRASDKTPGLRVITHEVPLVYTRGVTDALDVYVGITRQRIVPDAPAPSGQGWGNTAVGAKWRFYDNDASKLSFALKPEIRFPVSDSREAGGLGTARTSYSLGLLVTQETGFGAVHANLVAERANHADAALNAAERRTLYRLSLAPVWDVSENWKLAVDTGITTNPDRAARARMAYVELGAIYSPDKNLDLALGVMRNVMDNSADSWLATLGLTWRFR